MTKVSIILPSLNVHEYIEDCLKSVCNQQLQDVEIICVDAGSTDGTLEIIQNFAKKDERIKLILSEKKSYGLQMNLGVDASNGKYIGIVETDDYVRPEMFKHLYELAEKNDLDFIKADFYRFNHDEEGKELLYLNKLTDNISYYNRVVNPRIEKEVFKFVMNTWSGIYKREFLIKNNIRHNETPGASYQDTDFWFQTFSFAERAYFVDKPYYMNRRDNPNSSVYSNKKIYAFCDEYDYIYSKLFKDKKNKDLIPEFQFYRYRSYMSSLNKCEGDDKRRFIEKFKKDLLASKDRGELDLTLFTEGGKKTINLIINDTEKFISQQLKKRPVAYKLGTNSKEVLIAPKCINTPKVSVIIPLYNAEKFIKDCLTSVLKQTLIDIEVIIVNDGSTDSSLDIVKQFYEKDNRIILLSQPNSGSGKARNFGLSFAKGDYIAFMDSDDWYPDKDILETLYNKATSNSAKICGGSFSNYKNGVTNTKFVGNYRKYTFEKEGFIEFKDYQFDYGYHRFIYSRELIQKNNIEFPDLLRFQDPPFFLNCMKASSGFYAIPKIVYCYRKGENNVKWNPRKITDLLKGILFEVKFSKEQGYHMLHRIAIDHINVEFEKHIQPFLNFENIDIIETLFVINKEIDKDLLLKSGYKIDITKPYLVKPLRKFARKFEEKIESITIKTASREIILSGENDETSNQNKIIGNLRDENDKLKKKLETLRNGLSFKIGRFLTFVPRKIIDFTRK